MDNYEDESLIQIDRTQFPVEQSELSGEQLRQLPNPEVGPERDLFVVASGTEDDRLIANDELVPMKSGMQFITVPRTINPG